MRKLRIVSSLLILSMFAVGCAHADYADITVDISVREYDDSSIRLLRDSLSEWESDHPGIHIEELDRIRNADFNSLGRMGSDHLPDVLLQTV